MRERESKCVYDSEYHGECVCLCDGRIIIPYCVGVY